MILAAMMKTASTNFVTALSNATGTRWFDYCGAPTWKHRRYPAISEIGARYYNPNSLIDWQNDTVFYKLHMLPVKENLKHINEKNTTVLLRDPREVTWALRRAGVHIERWKSVKAEVAMFNTVWMDTDAKKVWFEDLVFDWEHFVKDVAKFYGLKIKNRIQTKFSDYYTGIGKRRLCA